MPDWGSGTPVRGARGGVVLACVASVSVAAAAAAAVIAGRSVAGPLAIVAGALIVGAAAAVGRPGRPRERILVAIADRAYDGAILGAVVWVVRSAEPALAAAALSAFGLGTLAAYARARACGLGYDLAFLAPVSVVRVAIVGLALTLGWGAPAYVALALWQAASGIVRVAQVWKEGLA